MVTKVLIGIGCGAAGAYLLGIVNSFFPLPGLRR